MNSGIGLRTPLVHVVTLSLNVQVCLSAAGLCAGVGGAHGDVSCGPVVIRGLPKGGPDA